MHTILLVDDAQSFLELGATFLQRADCRVLTASTGLEAIRVARIQRPDLVVLDIEMPEMNGLQACRVLKGDAATREIPVWILTSLQMEDEARRAGADRFVRKPVDEEGFLAEVRRFVPLVERAEPRAFLDADVVFWRDGEMARGSLTNLSRTGIYIETEAVQPVGSRLEISFTLPHDFTGKLVTAEAFVVRRTETLPRGIGCRFFKISTGARLYVEEYVERHGRLNGDADLRATAPKPSRAAS